MTEALHSGPISTRLRRLAELAEEHPDWAFRSIHHVIDATFLEAAYRRTRKGGAVGVDGQTAADYASNLDANLADLLDRFKKGLYRAPPVRRVHIPKGDGRTRPIGIPTFEDKVLQRAVAMVLEAIYEQDFGDCSYGFRPDRLAHDALEALWKALMDRETSWVVEVDIQSFFDALDHAHLRSFLDRRVTDGVLRRAIHKWLKAGVLEDGAVRRSDEGTPQGGVISPLLANIYLHEVLDSWFVEEVQPRLRGRARLIRYADDFVIVCTREHDARRILEVLPKRFGRYGLTLHPDKTQLVRFRRPPRERLPPDEWERRKPGSFDFLGLTHHWGRSRKGKPVVKRKTANGRFSRAMVRIRQWCRINRHRPVREQHAMLSLKLQGHYNYYGITGNFDALKRFAYEVRRCWRKWLDCRSHKARMKWERFNRLLERYPLPRPVVTHSVVRRSASP